MNLDPSPSDVLRWLAVLAATLVTIATVAILLGGIFGVATDCATSMDSEECRLWETAFLGSPLLLLGVWLPALGILRKSGRGYWTTTAAILIALLAVYLFVVSDVPLPAITRKRCCPRANTRLANSTQTHNEPRDDRD